MDHDFWHDRWAKNRIGFHQSTAHPMLVRHLPDLNLPESPRVFLPLCGKTLDIGWLLSQGCKVAGAELNQSAVDQLFEQLDITPKVSTQGALRKHSAPGLDIFAGDIFELRQDMLEPVDGVYDRAALVALPAEMRPTYAAHLAEITQNAPHLLISFEYDPSTVSGPPFPVHADEIARIYPTLTKQTLLDSSLMPSGLKGVSPAHELVYLLRADR